jgi:hypothetical protein
MYHPRTISVCLPLRHFGRPRVLKPMVFQNLMECTGLLVLCCLKIIKATIVKEMNLLLLQEFIRIISFARIQKITGYRTLRWIQRVLKNGSIQEVSLHWPEMHCLRSLSCKTATGNWAAHDRIYREEVSIRMLISATAEAACFCFSPNLVASKVQKQVQNRQHQTQQFR